MAGPIKTKTWKHWSITVPVGSGPAQQTVSGCTLDGTEPAIRQLMWEIKDALISSPGAWTVISSCGHNGSNFVYGNTDYWTSAARVWWQYNSEFSWIVLQNSAIASGFQLLIVCFGTSACAPETASFYISFGAGFIGGTTTARPTATDERSIKTTTSLWTSASSVNRGVQVFKSDDGECTRFYTTHNATLNQMWMFDKAISTNPKWTIPVLILGGNTPTYGGLVDSRVAVTKWGNVSSTAVWFATEGVGTTGPLGRQAGFATADVWGNWICTPIDVVYAAIYADPGILGKVRDLWFTSDDLVDGDYFPGDGSKQFVVLGDLVQPNEDGTTVPIY